MPETSLVVVDPGHFHATLVQHQMYPELSPVVRVYAPLGPDLIDYLSRIARYNRRPQAATDWRLDVHAGPDFLDRIRDQPLGGVAIFSGRNRGNIDRIIAVLETGLHVLADKPATVLSAAGVPVILCVREHLFALRLIARMGMQCSSPFRRLAVGALAWQAELCQARS